MNSNNKRLINNKEVRIKMLSSKPNKINNNKRIKINKNNSNKNSKYNLKDLVKLKSDSQFLYFSL